MVENVVTMNEMNVMNVMSFDVGIKNMAYCIFSIDRKTISIKDWNVLNLMEKQILFLQRFHEVFLRSQ